MKPSGLIDGSSGLVRGSSGLINGSSTAHQRLINGSSTAPPGRWVPSVRRTAREGFVTEELLEDVFSSGDRGEVDLERERQAA